MPSLRKTLLALVATLVAATMLTIASPAQSTPAGPTAAAADQTASTAGRGVRCPIMLVGRRIEYRQMMNRLKGAIEFNTGAIKKHRKAVAKAKKALKKSASRKNKKKLKAAKKLLKTEWAELKSNKGALPGAIKRFNEINTLAVSKGCAPDDGKPKGRRG